VSVNGADVSLADLVARGPQHAFAELRIELIDQVEVRGQVVIVFCCGAVTSAPSRARLIRLLDSRGRSR